MPRRSRAPEDLIADPFLERIPGLRTKRLQVLGGTFQFESDSAQLLRLVDRAYAGLPRHKLQPGAPDFRVRLVLRSQAQAAQVTDATRMRRGALSAARRLRASSARSSAQPPPVQMVSGAGILCSVTEWSDCVVVAPAERAALVVVSREMLRFPYHTRYELIEFAVCTLAARAQGLVSMHGACIGSAGRGLLLIGPGGSGKSTTALHALLGGLDFLSEDSVFVAPDSLLATGVANFLHVRAEGLRFLSRREDVGMIRGSPVIRRRSGIEKFEVDLRKRRFRLAPAPLRLAAVVLLSAQRAGDGTLLRPVSTSRLMSELQASQAYARCQPGWKAFSTGLAALPAFELRRGNHPDDSVDALRQLLKRNAGAR